MRRFLGLIFLVFISQQSFALSPDISSTRQFVTVADIHFSPFASCEKSARPCELVQELRQEDTQAWDSIFQKHQDEMVTNYFKDTNYLLLQSTIQKLHDLTNTEHPQFAFVLGDFLAHDFRKKFIAYTGDKSLADYTAFVKRTMQYLTAKIVYAFPNTPVYPVVGNNDSYQGDYRLSPNGEFFKDLGTMWSHDLIDKSNQHEFLNEFPIAGYYAVSVPNHANERILVLNTVLFSGRIKKPAVDLAAKEQLTWLHDELQAAQSHHQKVLLAFHIPVGVDVFATLKTFTMVQEFWKSSYTKEFLSELKQFPNVVTNILPAHIHMDTFQFITVQQLSDVPVNFTPSISPIFGNNPGFKVFSYNDTNFRLKDFTAYYFPINKSNTEWQKEYSFNHVFQPNCHQCYLADGMKQVLKNEKLMASFKQYYSVGHDSLATPYMSQWAYFWCDMHAIESGHYKECLNQSHVTWRDRVILSLSAYLPAFFRYN